MMSAPAAIAASTSVEALRLDLDRHFLPRRLHPLARLRATPPARRTWLSLIRMPSSSPTRWLRAAAGAHRILLQRAQRRRGLARVEDRDLPAGRVDEAPRQRRDAGQPLQEIERGSFGRQHRGRRAADLRDDGAGLARDRRRDS